MTSWLDFIPRGSQLMFICLAWPQVRDLENTTSADLKKEGTTLAALRHASSGSTPHDSQGSAELAR